MYDWMKCISSRDDLFEYDEKAGEMGCTKSHLPDSTSQPAAASSFNTLGWSCVARLWAVSENVIAGVSWRHLSSPAQGSARVPHTSMSANSKLRKEGEAEDQGVPLRTSELKSSTHLI